MPILSLRHYATAKRAVEDSETDDKALERAGIPDELIDEVFGNISKANKK